MRMNNVDICKASTFLEEVKADGPLFMGGSGMKLDPVQYCLFGLAACYAQTFAWLCRNPYLN